MRYTTGGKGVCTFGLAVNRSWQANGEWQEETSFFNVVCWNDIGENVAQSIDKGTRVLVTGRMVQRSWEDKEGVKRQTVEVVADDVGASLKWATSVTTRRGRNADQVAGAPPPPPEAKSKNGAQPVPVAAGK